MWSMIYYLDLRVQPSAILRQNSVWIVDGSFYLPEVVFERKSAQSIEIEQTSLNVIGIVHQGANIEGHKSVAVQFWSFVLKESLEITSSFDDVFSCIRRREHFDANM